MDEKKQPQPLPRDTRQEQYEAHTKALEDQGLATKADANLKATNDLLKAIVELKKSNDAHNKALLNAVANKPSGGRKNYPSKGIKNNLNNAESFYENLKEASANLSKSTGEANKSIKKTLNKMMRTSDSLKESADMTEYLGELLGKSSDKINTNIRKLIKGTDRIEKDADWLKESVDAQKEIKNKLYRTANKSVAATITAQKEADSTEKNRKKNSTDDSTFINELVKKIGELPFAKGVKNDLGQVALYALAASVDNLSRLIPGSNRDDGKRISHGVKAVMGAIGGFAIASAGKVTGLTKKGIEWGKGKISKLTSPKDTPKDTKVRKIQGVKPGNATKGATNAGKGLGSKLFTPIAYSVSTAQIAEGGYDMLNATSGKQLAGGIANVASGAAGLAGTWLLTKPAGKKHGGALIGTSLGLNYLGDKLSDSDSTKVNIKGKNYIGSTQKINREIVERDLANNPNYTKLSPDTIKGSSIILKQFYTDARYLHNTAIASAQELSDAVGGFNITSGLGSNGDGGSGSSHSGATHFEPKYTALDIAAKDGNHAELYAKVLQIDKEYRSKHGYGMVDLNNTHFGDPQHEDHIHLTFTKKYMDSALKEQVRFIDATLQTITSMMMANSQYHHMPSGNSFVNDLQERGNRS